LLTFKYSGSNGNIPGKSPEAECPTAAAAPCTTNRIVGDGRRQCNEVKQYARLETDTAPLISQRLEWSFGELRGRQLATHICRTSTNKRLAFTDDFAGDGN